MVHVRRVGGRALRFGHRGWLWHNAYILYDTETDSLWHHQTGRAMAGPLRGKRLARYPTSLMTWAAWSAEYPETLVLPIPPGHEGRRGDVYARRNRVISIGIGVDTEEASRLFPYSSVAAFGAVNDEVGGVPVVVAVDEIGRTAHAYGRTVGDSVIELELRTAEGGAVLGEIGGQRAWSLRSGRPIPGSGATEPLPAVLSSQWEVSAWALQHPDGTRFR